MAHKLNKPNSSVARRNRYKLMGLLILCGAQLGQAAEIKIGVSLSIPPYVIQATNSGIELELLNQALAVKGHTASIHYLPLARTFHELRRVNSMASSTSKKE